MLVENNTSEGVVYQVQRNINQLNSWVEYMKIVFSRKGFDNTAGGKPSPIFENGSMASVPIPETENYNAGIDYGRLQIPWTPFATVGQMLSHIYARTWLPPNHAHLDPDIETSIYDREDGWRALFGQDTGFQTHLANNGVREGDLFLFFGLFQDVQERNDGRIQYQANTFRRHVIFGWLTVGEIVTVDDPRGRSWLRHNRWARYHSHFNPHRMVPNNTVYVATDKSFKGLPGAGTFKHYHECLCLSAAGQEQCSLWELPDWYDPPRCDGPFSRRCRTSAISSLRQPRLPPSLASGVGINSGVKLRNEDVDLSGK
jgi:hypothetical protein